MAATGANRGKIRDLLSHARERPGIAAECILALEVGREDTDNEFDRQLVAAVLQAEHWATMRALRIELRSFLKAMAK